MTSEFKSTEVKPAASILLMRETPKQDLNPLEVFMVMRHHQIDVASGALVFPGGKVEKQDSADALANFYPHACQTRLTSSPLYQNQLGFKVAAIREAYEETGVLFARQQGEKELIGANALAQLKHYKEALVNEEITLAVMLAEQKLSLATDLLLPYAHWITPKMAPKRFDTHFFIALAPQDQVALHDGEESVDSLWIAPQTLLKEADEGRWKIVFPTRMNIEKLALMDSFQSIKTQVEKFPPITIEPKFVDLDGEKFLCIPEEAGYPQWKVSIDKVLKP